MAGIPKRVQVEGQRLQVVKQNVWSPMPAAQFYLSFRSNPFPAYALAQQIILVISRCFAAQIFAIHNF
jgi:hypothetical protein